MKLPSFITRDDLLCASCMFCGSPLAQQANLLPDVKWNHLDFICTTCPQPSVNDRYIDNCEVTYRDVNGKSKGLIYTLDMVFIRFSQFTIDVLYQSTLTLIFDRECSNLLGEVPTIDWNYYDLKELEKQIKVRLTFL